jgi:hypothetical protein
MKVKYIVQLTRLSTSSYSRHAEDGDKRPYPKSSTSAPPKTGLLREWEAAANSARGVSRPQSRVAAVGLARRPWALSPAELGKARHW